MKKLMITCLLSASFSYLFSQTISGTVKDASGKPLAGVSVKVMETGKGMNTSEDGLYQLAVTAGKAKLNFILTGYASKDTVLDVPVLGTLRVDIVLEEKKDELDEVVIVSSSRTNSRIEDLPTKVEVLGAEEVHEENGIKPGNIASLLGDIAGIQIQQTNAATGNADMRIQGLQGKYTQVLRDGMPLFGGYAGSFSILQIPPLDLQQIELVKGASSTLYGGGAIAGMVNLVSKTPKLGKPEAAITLNRSTLKENNANLFFSGRNHTAGYTVFAGGTLQQQTDVDKDGFSDVPSVKSVFVHPRLFLYGGDRSTVTLGYTFNYEDRNGGDMEVLDGHSSAAHTFFIRNKSLRNTADITWNRQLAGNASFTARGSTSFFNRDISSNVFGMKGSQFTWYSEFAYTQKTEKHNWVAGINFNGDDFRKNLPDSSLLPNESSNTLGLFAQDDWKLAHLLTLQAGLRTDISSRYGVFVLPRVSLMYKVSHAVTMRMGGGLGYKTPVLFNTEIDERDYHYIRGYAGGIRSERSLGVNYDINYKTRAGEWELTCNQTFFYNMVKDPILLATTGATPLVYQYVNTTGKLQSAGFETYIQALGDPWELYLGYVYTHARRTYNAAAPNLPLIARNKIASVIAYEFSSHFRAGIEAAYTGRQYLDNGSKTDPYLFMAMMIRYNVGKAAFVLNCENLFDYRQNRNASLVQPPLTNPSFPEIWAPLDGRVVNLSVYIKLK